MTDNVEKIVIDKILRIYKSVDFSIYNSPDVYEKCRSFKMKIKTGGIEKVYSPLHEEEADAVRVQFYVIRGIPEGDTFKLHSYKDAGIVHEFIDTTP